MDVRQIVIGDAPSVQAIYAPYVTDTIVSFEEVPPDIMEVERRIAAILPRYPYLVAEEHGRILGYAYASEHRTRTAYRKSVDVTVSVTLGVQRIGVARQVYSHLLTAAASLGCHAEFAVIACRTQPRDVSTETKN